MTVKSLLHIDVWEVELTAKRPLDALLTAAEHERAAALKAPGATERWIVARAALRIVLGERLGLDPGDVVFGAGPQGKPELPGARLRFNLAHSGERALIALAEGVEVGVDVESTGRSSRAVERTLTDGSVPPCRMKTATRTAARVVPQGGAGEGDRDRPRLGARDVRHEPPRSLHARRPRLDDDYVGALAVGGAAAEIIVAASPSEVLGWSVLGPTCASSHRSSARPPRARRARGRAHARP